MKADCPKCGKPLLTIWRPEAMAWVEDDNVTKCPHCGAYFRWEVKFSYIKG